MSDLISNGRWAVSDSLFASRITIPDVKGFFLKLPIIGEVGGQRQLIIEPGTRALIVDEGSVLGEAHAGTFTLESFTERLQFWRGKQFTVIITRSEDIVMRFSSVQCMTVEGVVASLDLEVLVQVKDVLAFLKNMMGAKDQVDLSGVAKAFEPICAQAAREAVGSMAIEDLSKPTFADRLADGIRSRVDIKLQRYGFGFTNLHSVSHHSDADGIDTKRGEIFLKKREQELAKTATDSKFEQLQSNLDAAPERIRIRSEIRSALSEDKVASLQSKEDLKQAVQEIDKQRLLRQEERDELVEAFEERKDDRTGMREHLLATIDLQREQELDVLQSDIAHSSRMKSLGQEIEYARGVDLHDNEQWIAELEKDKKQAAHRFEQRRAAADAKWKQIRQIRTEKRDDSWEALLHDQKMEEVRADVDVAKAERQSKVAVIEVDLQNRLAGEKLAIEKRQKEWELEFKQQKSANQIERLEKVQEMNARFAEQQQRMKLELETLKEDSAHKREMERIQTMGDLSTEALIAASGTANAALLADLKKHEASEDTAKVQASNTTDAALNEERLRMYEKMNDTEKAKAEAIAQAYKEAMQSQQANVQQMIGGLAQANTPQKPVKPGYGAPAYPTTQPAAAPPPMPASDVWHVSINGAASPPMNLQQVQQSIQSGQVIASTMVWKTGMTGWQAANTLPELAGSFGPTSIPQGGMTPGPPPV